MSKGQRGNKEAKKPKREPVAPVAPGTAVAAAVPSSAAQILARAKRR